MKKRGHSLGSHIKRTAVLMISAFAVFAVSLAVSSGISTILLKASQAMPDTAIRQLKDHFEDRIAVTEPQSDVYKERQEPSAALPTVEALPPEPSESARDEDKAVDKSHLAESAPKGPAPEIPEKYKGRVLSEDMSDSEGDIAIAFDNFRLRNYTPIPTVEIKEILERPTALRLEDTTEPQVLIYHTHATESYCPYDDGYYDTRYNWRSTDNNNNMVAVGAVMAQALRENGISVIQDTRQHDYPSYDGSYANSYRSIKDNLEAYPTIKVVLDIHRDAIERESGLIVKPVIEFEGERYAQLMLVSNCDDGSGLLPNWKENLRFAAAFSRELEQAVPNITRPILFSYRKYNQQLSNGALLLEFGTHANTMEEAQRTARVAGQALAKLLNITKEQQ